MTCLLDKQAAFPTCHTMWPPPCQRGPRGHTSPPSPNDTDLTRDDHEDCHSEFADPLPILSPHCRRLPPPPPSPCHHQPRINYEDPEMAGQNLEHSLLQSIRTWTGGHRNGIKVQYRDLALIFHLDNHDPTRTGMTHEAAAEYFKLINNAQA